MYTSVVFLSLDDFLFDNDFLLFFDARLSSEVLFAGCLIVTDATTFRIKVQLKQKLQQLRRIVQ